jgi:hypothetical protein
MATRKQRAGQYCVYMYVNEKMTTVETVPGMGGVEDKGE